MARPPRETVRHHEMFEAYYWVGDQRSYSQVARKFNLSPTAVANASKAFKWPDRVRERDDKVIAALKKRADAEAVAVKERQLKITRAMQIKFAARLSPQAAAQGATPYEPNGTDAVRAMQHELLLTGGATSRPDLKIGGEALDAFLAAVTLVLRRPRACPGCRTSLDLGREIGAELLALSQRAALAQDAAVDVAKDGGA